MNDPLSGTLLRGSRRFPVACHPLPLRAQGGGGDRDRTDDLKLAKLPLSQLSYAPMGTGHTAVARKASDGGPGKT